VRAYLDHLTVERALAANTLSSYRRDLNRYAGALGVTDLAAVTPRHVAGYLAALREGDAAHPAAVRRIGRPRGVRGARPAPVRGPRGAHPGRPGPRHHPADAAAPPPESA